MLLTAYHLNVTCVEAHWNHCLERFNSALIQKHYSHTWSEITKAYFQRMLQGVKYTKDTAMEPQDHNLVTIIRQPTIIQVMYYTLGA